MNLDPRSTKTLYEQIYEYIRDEIRKGTLKCGERLPSTRLLGVSPGREPKYCPACL